MFMFAGRLPAGQVKRQANAPTSTTGSLQLIASRVTDAQVAIAPPSSSTSVSIPIAALSHTTLSSSAVATVNVPTPTTSPLSSTPLRIVPHRVSSTGMGSATPSSSDSASDSLAQHSDLPPGAIAGVVLAIVLALLALMVFLMRKRLIRHRQQRSEAWKESIFTKSAHVNPKDDGQVMDRRETAFSVSATFAPRMNLSRVPVPVVPSSIYNHPRLEGAENVESVYGDNVPVDAVTVITTFIPSMPDELTVSLGETLRLLTKYDDGWAMCMKSSGEEGMVPVECLEKSRVMPLHHLRTAT